MKTGIATPEKNTQRSITMPARVVTPLDAWVLYSQGSPIDRMAGYYKKQGILDDDFYMMDQVGRLRALAEYRELTKRLREESDTLQLQVNDIERLKKEQAAENQYNAWRQRFQAEQQVTKQPE